MGYRGRPRSLGAFLFLVVLHQGTIKCVFGLKNGDCLRSDSAPFFQLSPGGYDPTKGMDGPVCQGLCAAISAPFSGVQSKQYCLCSDDPFGKE